MSDIQSKLIVVGRDGSAFIPEAVVCQDRLSVRSFIDRLVYLVTGRHGVDLRRSMGTTWVVPPTQ